MNENNSYVDPLEKLLEKHNKASSESIKETETSQIIDVGTPLDPDYTDIDYGDTDIDEEIKNEERMEAEQREEALRNIKKEPDVFMPPDERDMSYHSEAIGFQATTLAVVTTMVNKVVAKYHITSGGISETDIPKKGILGKMKVMGELIELYHVNGEVINDEFENVLLSNWILDNGLTAMEYINNPDLVKSDEQKTKNDESDNGDAEDDTKSEIIPTIYIDTTKSETPVNVTVDESLVTKMTSSNKINVHVRQVTDVEIDESKVIVDSDQSEIIKPYVCETGDCPISLPMSAYRCVMTPVTWFESFSAASPTSNNPIDQEIKKWTTIYNHMKNISIGEFEDFDDFLKKTKYQDRELLLWGILVGTVEDTIEIGATCNKKLPNGEICNTYHTGHFDPRNMLHLEPELIPASYKKTCDVAPGPAAVAHWKENGMDVTRYTLPDSKYIVEVNDPSAYEWITNRLPATQDALKKYGPPDENRPMNDPSMALFGYMAAHITTIHAIIIPGEDGKSYKYTTWENIEKIITTGLSAKDSTCLFRICSQARDRFISPVTFYVEDLKCPRCGHVSKRVVINNIEEQLLFHQSQLLTNTEVDWIEAE